MAELQSFSPGYGSGVIVTAGAASATASLLGATSTALCITNSGTVIAYLRTGDSGAAASTADYPVLGGQQVSITINANHTHFAYIAPSGAPVLHVMRGEGI
jgi:hypothetical protein